MVEIMKTCTGALTINSIPDGLNFLVLTMRITRSPSKARVTTPAPISQARRLLTAKAKHAIRKMLLAGQPYTKALLLGLNTPKIPLSVIKAARTRTGTTLLASLEERRK